MNHSANMLSPMPYRSDIDGLRAVAVLAVVAFHAFPVWFKGGFIGVDIFFVISGFLISQIILSGLQARQFSMAHFYARRIRRIFPALATVLSGCFIFGWFGLFADEYAQLGKHMAAGAIFISNYVLYHEVGYFDNAAHTKPLLHLWSLAIEEQFYIVWPVILWIAYKIRLPILGLIIVAAVLSFAMSLYGIALDKSAAFYMPYMRAWELLLGAALAYVSLYHSTLFHMQHLPAATRTKIQHSVSCIGAILITLSIALITKQKDFPGVWALLPTLGALCILIAGQSAMINLRLLSSPISVWFGRISFPLYLWHWPLLSFISIVESELMPVKSLRIGAVIVSLGLAWLTTRYIEKPMRYGDGGHIKTLTLVFVMMAIGALGYCTYLKQGYPMRPSVKQFQNNMEQLQHPDATDEACLKRIGNTKPLFPYCRFDDAGGKTTVAITGDSHAHAAFSGVSALLQREKINTLVLANSGCPPFLGAHYGSNASEKLACKQRIAAIVKTINGQSDIKKVFIFSRGTAYFTGKYFGEAELGANKGPLIDRELFIKGLQATIDALHKAGKHVFYVAENPEIPLMPNACIKRPMRIAQKSCDVALTEVMARQKDYLEMLKSLKHVTVIQTIPQFCADGVCRAFHKGKLLYADFDHLSHAGNAFLAKYILAPYLLGHHKQD